MLHQRVEYARLSLSHQNLARSTSNQSSLTARCHRVERPDAILFSTGENSPAIDSLRSTGCFPRRRDVASGVDPQRHELHIGGLFHVLSPFGLRCAFTSLGIDVLFLGFISTLFLVNSLLQNFGGLVTVIVFVNVESHLWLC